MSDEKKIIIDEDWKTRVAAEKDEANRREKTSPEPAETGGPSMADAPTMPPASFELLVTMLATEAMAGLGQLPNPLTGQLESDPAGARYAIDMLEMLADKTKGNLTPQEDFGLRELLHQLRMAFVALQSAPTAPAE